MEHREQNFNRDECSECHRGSCKHYIFLLLQDLFWSSGRSSLTLLNKPNMYILSQKSERSADQLFLHKQSLKGQLS